MRGGGIPSSAIFLTSSVSGRVCAKFKCPRRVKGLQFSISDKAGNGLVPVTGVYVSICMYLHTSRTHLFVYRDGDMRFELWKTLQKNFHRSFRGREREREAELL